MEHTDLQRLKKVVKWLIFSGFGENEKELAELLGYTKSSFSQILNGKVPLSDKFLDKICSLDNNINKVWILENKGEMLKSSNNTPAVAEPQLPSGVPMLPFDAFAGIGTDVEGVNLDTIEERYVVPLFDGMKMDFMISVRGSSMYPKYNSGDVVACRMVQELLFVQWNKVYVLDTISQGVIIKRLKKSDKEGFVICKSDNEQYEPFEIPMSDIRTIALVVGVIRLE
uniref:Putative transcriptional regulator n=1 Tax=Myoviridae sp. ctOoC8 TaxID=2823542 RepID=A0A8S5L691_9CAUD|nr:MAG TPA: putative transcriptional regulator [Myoviridae sp. ctOoC8]